MDSARFHEFSDWVTIDHEKFEAEIGCELARSL